MTHGEDCSWCRNRKGKTDLNFTVIDDDFGQYVHPKLIKYCPFCGRKIQEESKMKIKLDTGAYMPERAHDADAGLDLRTPKGFEIEPGKAQ